MGDLEPILEEAEELSNIERTINGFKKLPPLPDISADIDQFAHDEPLYPEQDMTTYDDTIFTDQELETGIRDPVADARRSRGEFTQEEIRKMSVGGRIKRPVAVIEREEDLIADVKKKSPQIRKKIEDKWRSKALDRVRQRELENYGKTYEQARQETIASEKAYQRELERIRSRKRFRANNDPRNLKRLEAEGEYKRKYLADRERRRAKNIRDNIRRKRMAERRRWAEKVLNDLYRNAPAIAGGSISAGSMAILIKEFADWIVAVDEKVFEARERFQKSIDKLETDLGVDGTNIGTMNPEVRRTKQFGTEALFETSQGDLYYDEEQNIMIIAYRGTDFARLFSGRPDLAIIDIINDLNITATDYNGLRVHSGFLNMFLESLPEVQEFIDENMNDETIVYTTGHSAGSPSAVLLAYLINQHRGNQHAICYTFGSPRFIIEGASEELIKQTVPHLFRVTTDSDIIPYLPPRIVPNIVKQYIHVGTEYIFKAEHQGGYGIVEGDTRTARSLYDLGKTLAGLLAGYLFAYKVVMPDGTTVASRLASVMRPDLFTMGIINEISDGFYRLFSFLYPASNFFFEGLEQSYNRLIQEARNRFLFDFPQAREIMDRIPDPQSFRDEWLQDEYGGRRFDSFYYFQGSIAGLGDELRTGRDDFGSDPMNIVGRIRLNALGIPVERYKKFLASIIRIFSQRAIVGAVTTRPQRQANAPDPNENYLRMMRLAFPNERAFQIVTALFPRFDFITDLLIKGTGIYMAGSIMRGIYGLATGQIDRFMGHRTSVYETTLRAFTDNKVSLGFSMKPESEILGDNDCSTAEGVFTKSKEEHFGRPVYESDGMRFTPHFHKGEIYMNHLPNLDQAIMGYYLYKPDEFKNRQGQIKGFVLF